MEFNATFLVSGISFVVFAILMNIVMYNPLARIVEQRKNFVDGNYEEAENANQKATSLIKDRADRLAIAGSDARKVMTEITDNAKAEKAERCLSAKNVANEEVKSKKDELLTASNNASNELRHHVKSIAETISSKVLGEQVNIEYVDEEAINKIMQEG